MYNKLFTDDMSEGVFQCASVMVCILNRSEHLKRNTIMIIANHKDCFELLPLLRFAHCEKYEMRKVLRRRKGRKIKDTHESSNMYVT